MVDVMHSEGAISPPDEFENEQHYLHNHQTDHNLGEILINTTWDEPTCDLSEKIYGALEILLELILGQSLEEETLF